MPSVFLTAEWRNLLMVNYVVEPTTLAPYLPAGTELDFWRGETYVSIVGFQFLRTRLSGVPVPFHRNFEQLNLRFYVRRRTPEGWRKGVVFIKEIVPKWAVAFVARTVYREHYVRMPMRSRIEIPGPISYEWCYGGDWDSVSGTAVGSPYLPDADAEATYITEHYWGYARQRDGSTFEYEVRHPHWPVRQCESPVLSCRVPELYSERFTEFLSVPPRSAFVVDGSAVSVHRGNRLVG